MAARRASQAPAAAPVDMAAPAEFPAPHPSRHLTTSTSAVHVRPRRARCRGGVGRARPHPCSWRRAHSSPVRLLAAAERHREEELGAGRRAASGSLSVRWRPRSGRRGGSSTGVAMMPGAAVARAPAEAGVFQRQEVVGPTCQVT
jgi:hypothetical protein